MKALAAATPILRDIWCENRGFDRLGYMGRALAWRVRKRVGRSFVVRLRNGVRLHVEPASSFSSIFYFRWPDRPEMLFMRANSQLAPVFVDVGANVGIFSAMLADVFERSYLFEPGDTAFSALKKTAQLNAGFDFQLFKAAVSDKAGRLRFCDEGNYSPTSRVIQDASDDSRIREVECLRLDDALACERGGMVMKVDVEGHELSVFRGARNLFHRKQVRLVMFERLGRTDLNKVCDFFSSVGYVIFHVTNRGQITRDQLAIAVPKINLFACPAELAPLLRQA